MPYVIKKTKKNGTDMYCVHKEGADGKPTGDSLGCSDTREMAKKHMAAMYANEGKSAPEIEELIKSIKMDEASYVPWGVTSLADALAAEDAQETAHEINCLVDMFSQVAYNIAASSDVADKKASLASLAGELQTMLTEEISGTASSDTANADGGDGKSVEDYMTIKSIGENRVGGYAVMWGSETKKDLTGEYFDTQTAELTSIFDSVGRLPFMYHHGLDETLKTRVTGIIDTLKPDSIGLWYEAQLRMADEYDVQIKKMIDEGKLKTSSQTFAVARQVSKSGHIDRWPIVEVTATPTPAEYRMSPIATLKSAYQEVGCNDLSCVLKTLGITDESEELGTEKVKLALLTEIAELELIDF